jgi:hypothetical protein
MSSHLGDDLPQLLTGEATRDVTLAAAAHLRECPDCQQELVSAVVAHAALASAQRFAPDVVTHGPADRDPAADGSDTTPLPDLSGLFARVHAESAPTASGHRTRNRWLAAAAAAVVLAGAGVTIAETTGGGSSGPATRSVALSSPGGTRSTATLIGDDHMRIDATALPKLTAGEQYEVWLTKPGSTDPQAVGFVGADRRADLHVPADLMSTYDVIAVSRQARHQTTYSGDLVLSGRY